MSLTRVIAVTVLPALLASVGFARDAQAASLLACDADDIISQDPVCGDTGTCVISNDFAIGKGCVIDFGTRDVAVAASSKIIIGTASVTCMTGDSIVVPGGDIDGRTTAVGGSEIVEASGDIELQRSSSSRGKVRVSGSSLGGNVLFGAGANITMASQLHANNRDVGAGDGGVIMMR
jgi:hypothetical protein